MNNQFSKTALTVGAWTVLTVVMRVWILPLMEANLWRYLVLYAYLVGCVVFWAVRRRQKRKQYAFPIEGARSRVVGVGALIASASLLLTQGYDIVQYVTTGRMPAPSAEAVSGMDVALFALALLLGLAACGCLFWLGRKWASGVREDPLIGNGWATLLVSLWLWARVARYITAYAFAVDIQDSLFEYVILAVSLLWMYLLGKRAVESAAVSSGTLHALTEAVAMLAVSGGLSRLGALVVHTQTATTFLSVVTFADVCLGVLAWALLWYWNAPYSQDNEA